MPEEQWRASEKHYGSFAAHCLSYLRDTSRTPARWVAEVSNRKECCAMGSKDQGCLQELGWSLTSAQHAQLCSANSPSSCLTPFQLWPQFRSLFSDHLSSSQVFSQLFSPAIFFILYHLSSTFSTLLSDSHLCPTASQPFSTRLNYSSHLSPPLLNSSHLFSSRLTSFSAHFTSFNKETFTHRRFYTQELLQREDFTQRKLLQSFPERSSYTQKLFRRARFNTEQAFAQSSSYTQQAFTQRSFYTQKLFHRDSFTQSKILHRARFYTEKLFHGKSFYTEKAFAQSKLYTEQAFAQRSVHTDNLLHRMRQNGEKSAAKAPCATIMQPLQYDLRPSAAKDSATTHAAAAARNFDAAIPLKHSVNEEEKKTPETLSSTARTLAWRQIPCWSGDARNRRTSEPTFLCIGTSFYQKSIQIASTL